jgi:hypothetical protein
MHRVAGRCAITSAAQPQASVMGGAAPVASRDIPPKRDITDIIGGWEVEADLNQLAVSGRRYGQLKSSKLYRGCVQVPKRRLEVAVFGAIRVDVLEGCGDSVDAVAEPFEVRNADGHFMRLQRAGQLTPPQLVGPLAARLAAVLTRPSARFIALDQTSAAPLAPGDPASFRHSTKIASQRAAEAQFRYRDRERSSGLLIADGA